MDPMARLWASQMSRRALLKAGAAAGLGTAAAGMLGTRRVWAQDEQLAPATLELWHQDWPPINAAYQSLKEAVENALRSEGGVQ